MPLGQRTRLLRLGGAPPSPAARTGVGLAGMIHFGWRRSRWSAHRARSPDRSCHMAARPRPAPVMPVDVLAPEHHDGFIPCIPPELNLVEALSEGHSGTSPREGP